MTKQEFIDRTNYYPTDEQFKEIHEAYMAAGDTIDKDTFCNRWKREGGYYWSSKETAMKIDLLQMKLEKMEKMLEEANCKAIEFEGRLIEEAKAYSQALKEAEKWRGVVNAIKMSIPNE